MTNTFKESLTMKEIVQKIKTGLKETGCKWSIVKSEYSMGASITISLMEAPFDAFKQGNEKTYKQINQYHLEDTSITDEARQLLKKALDLSNVYNWDHSEPETDYFDVNFYLHLQIGKWNKPFRKVI